MPARAPWSPRLVGVLFAAPAVAMIGLFVYAPFVQSVRYSFTDWDGVNAPSSVGWANYGDLLRSPDFQRVLLNEAILVAGIVVWIGVPFVLAVATHGLRGAGVIRTLVFVPVLLPPIVAANVFRLLLADNGPLTGAVETLTAGSIAPGWLTDASIVNLSVVSVLAWALMGAGVLFYAAGLASLPGSQVEAARMDGASWWQVTWNIYRPHLRSVTRFWALLLIVMTVTAFFPWIYGLTRGGPGVASTSLDYDVYQTSLQYGQFGRGAAIAVVNVLIVALLLGTCLAISRWRNRHDQ